MISRRVQVEPFNKLYPETLSNFMKRQNAKCRAFLEAKGLSKLQIPRQNDEDTNQSEVIEVVFHTI